MSTSRNPSGSNRTKTSRPISSSITSDRIPFSFDLNSYQQKKTVAEGMMDLALMSANANQLRYVITSKDDAYRYVSLVLISISFVLQVVVGIGLICNIKYDINHQEQSEKANRANNWTIIGIFLVTVLNVVISSFGVTQAQAECLQFTNLPKNVN